MVFSDKLERFLRGGRAMHRVPIHDLAPEDPAGRPEVRTVRAS